MQFGYYTYRLNANAICAFATLCSLSAKILLETTFDVFPVQVRRLSPEKPEI